MSTLHRQRPSGRGPRRSAVAAVAGFGLLAATVSATGPALAAPTDAAPTDAGTAFTAGRYVVSLVEDPAATYTGGVAGLSATKPAPGEDLDAESAPVREYQSFLREQQEQVAAEVAAEPEYSYTAAVNGFSAELSAAQATKLAATRGVLSVVPDEERELDTVHSPEFLGLSGEDGLWAGLGGTDAAGEGVVVGVIDSGVTPENPSFAGEPVTSTTPVDEVGGTYLDGSSIAVTKADGDTFLGECEAGGTFTADLCNDKLVSARSFSTGFVASVDPADWSEFEEVSPRDSDGHGTHTASTAAGNTDVPMSVDGIDFGTGSGVAPGAKLATYKVCWEDTDPATGGCYTSDSVAAIDQAVLDGVDVLNYSISGSLTSSLDPVEVAFLSAASAGVFVAVSAGNSGPGTSTVAHNSPWLTTVAASTHHNYYGTVELGDGTQYRGISVSDTGVPAQTEVVLSSASGVTGAPAGELAQCYANRLDPAAVTGKIVVCDRGGNDRVAKSLEVQRAGGVGMVLANVTPGSVDADVHWVPTVHVDEIAGAAIKAYVSGTPDATAALLPGDQTGAEPLATPVVAGFSSRGPALAHGGDLLKPDISAPGVSVLAAVAPGPNNGRDFNFLSGTSMSSPHVAGLGALVLGENPTWSPMAVKSAMMTTAYDLQNEDGSTDANRFNSGAGHVDPSRMLDPGLVYESDDADWLSFLEGTSGQDLLDGIEPIDPSDLNQPSIAVGDLAGSQTVTRTVTATTPGIYRAQASVPGMDVRVTPSVLNFTAAGQSKSFRVTLTRATAPVDTYAQGSLTWTGRGTSVRSPVVAEPVALSAPAEVSGAVADEELSYQVVPGVPGRISMTLDGMAPGERSEDTLVSGQPLTPGRTNASLDIYEMVVPAGAQLAQIDLGAGAGATDLDLVVTDAALTRVVAQSATPSAGESITLRNPPAGRYLVHVHAYETEAGGGSYTLDRFVVAGSEGNAVVTPQSLVARQGRPATVRITYPGLEEGTPYLGVVSYSGSTSQTLVRLD